MVLTAYAMQKYVPAERWWWILEKTMQENGENCKYFIYEQTFMTYKIIRNKFVQE